MLENAYGVMQVNVCNNQIDGIVEDIAYKGYSVVHNVLSAKEVEKFNKGIDAVYKTQQDEVDGEAKLNLINDANIVRCPLAYDEAFVELACHKLLIDVATRVLGESFILLMQNGIINKPDTTHYQTKWHRDLNYQHWVCSKPLAINALFCLDPFTVKTGGTRVIPGTHLKENFPSERYIKENAITAEAEPGALIIMDAMLYHGAGANTSDIIRRGINHVLGAPILSPQISFPDILQGRFKEDAFLEKYLGYRWKPKTSVQEWRIERLEELKK